MNLRETVLRIFDERRISRRRESRFAAVRSFRGVHGAVTTLSCDVSPLPSATCEEPEQEPSARQSHHPKHPTPEPLRGSIEVGERQGVIQSLRRLMNEDGVCRETVSARRGRPSHGHRIITPIDRQSSRPANERELGGIGRGEPQMDLRGCGGLAENPVSRPQIEGSERSPRHVSRLGFHRGERIRRLPQRGTVI